MANETIETYIADIAATKDITPEDAIERLLDDVDPTDIQGASSTWRRKLRDTLIEIGVSVRKGTGVSIKRALLDLYPPESLSQGIGNNASTQSAPSNPAVIPRQPDIFQYINAVQKHYPHEQSRYNGALNQSLPHHRKVYAAVCDSLNIPPEIRVTAMHLILADGPEHKILTLYHNMQNKPNVDAIWKRIEKQVYTRARKNYLLSEWHKISYDDLLRSKKSYAKTLKSLVSQLRELHPQLPPIFEAEEHLHCRILSCISNQQWASNIYTNPPEALQPLLDQLQIAAVYADTHTPYTRTQITLSQNQANDPAPLPSFLTDSADDFEYEIASNENDPCALDSECYYVLRRFRRNSNIPPQSFRFRTRRPGSFRGPSRNHPCAICRSAEHWARECPARVPSDQRATSNVVDRITEGIPPPCTDRTFPPFLQLPETTPAPTDLTDYLYTLAIGDSHSAQELPSRSPSLWTNKYNYAAASTPNDLKRTPGLATASEAFSTWTPPHTLTPMTSSSMVFLNHQADNGTRFAAPPAKSLPRSTSDRMTHLSDHASDGISSAALQTPFIDDSSRSYMTDHAPTGALLPTYFGPPPSSSISGGAHFPRNPNPGNHRLIDTCTEHDLIGEACFLSYYNLRRPYHSPTAFFSFGRDTPRTIAATPITIQTQDTQGTPMRLNSPSVNIVKDSPAPLLIGWRTLQAWRAIIIPERSILYVTPRRSIIQLLTINGHPALPFSITPGSKRGYSFYTRAELLMIHRQFGHASVELLIRRFPRNTFSREDIQSLLEIARSCRPCQYYSQLPRRPRVTLPTPAVFNKQIAVDTFSIRANLPKVLDITCTGTDFGQGRFVHSLKGEYIFSVVYIVWLCTYGLCESILSDRGGENWNNAFTESCRSLGILHRLIPTESPWSNGRCERHHAPISSAFLKAEMDAPSVDKQVLLASAYKARNDFPRAHGFSPTQAVLGEIPRFLVGQNDHWDPSIAARGRAIHAARCSMDRYAATDRLRYALGHPSPTVPYVSPGEEVLFHRSDKGWRRGTVQSIEGKTVIVSHDGRNYSCAESRVKPYVPNIQDEDARYPAVARFNTSEPDEIPVSPAPTSKNVPCSRSHLSNALPPPSHPMWDQAKQVEIEKFRRMNVMREVEPSEIPKVLPEDAEVLPYTWFCDRKDRGNGKPEERARFCAQGQRSRFRDVIIATSPVVQQSVLRIFLSMASTHRWQISTEDFKRAYLQSDPLPVTQQLYVKTPPEAGLPPGSVWAFRYPLYGQVDAGRRFFFTFDSRLMNIPEMQRSIAPGLYYIPKHGAIATYSDDHARAGSPYFQKKIQPFLDSFETHVTDTESLKYAGMNIEQGDSDSIVAHQEPYVAKLESFDTNMSPNTPLLDELKEKVASTLHKLLWVARTSRPDLIVPLSIISSRPFIQHEHIVLLNNVLFYIQSNPVKLKFPRLEKSSLRALMYADFSGSIQTPREKRVMGFVTFLTDATHKVAPINWCSRIPRKICRGTGAGEAQALADGTAQAIYDVRVIQELFYQRVPLSIFTDSKCVFDACVSFCPTTDLRALSDILAIRDSLARCEIEEINWIDTKDNPADCLTKSPFASRKNNGVLTTCLRTGYLDTPVRASVTRDTMRADSRPDLSLS